MAAATLKVHVEVTSDAQLEELLCGKGCKVLELYSPWCGPCKSVLPTVRRIRIEKDDDAALLFLLVNNETCNYLDVAKEHRQKSEPLFLVYRNGQLKAKVDGANTPVLSTAILQYTPTNADMDDLEDNPLYQVKKEREKAKEDAAKAAAAKSKKKK